RSKESLFFLGRRWSRRLQQRPGGPRRMSDNEHSNNSVNGKVIQGDLLWGAEEIGQAINRNARQTHHLLTTGALKCVQKKGGRWVASRSALLRELGAA